MAVNTRHVITCMEISDRLRDVEDWDDEFVPSIYVYGFLEEQHSFIYGATGIKLQGLFKSSNRCPLDFRLRSGEAQGWRCDISLNFDNAVEEDFYFSREVPFMSNIRSPHEAALAILKAQKTILNPSYGIAKLANEGLMDPTARDEIFSSANYVTIKITGAPFNLSFVTLPAISSHLSAKDIQDEEKDMTEDALLVLNSSNVMLIIALRYGNDQTNKDLDNELCQAGKRAEKVIFIKRGDDVPPQCLSSFTRECYLKGACTIKEPRLVPFQEANSNRADCPNDLVPASVEAKWSHKPYSRAIGDICLNFTNMLVPMRPAICRKILKGMQDIDLEYQSLKPLPSNLKKELLRRIKRYSREFGAALAPDMGPRKNLDHHLERLAWTFTETQPKLTFKPEGKAYCPYLDYTGNPCYWYFSYESVKSLGAARNDASSSSSLKYPFLGIALHCQQSWSHETACAIEQIHLDFIHLIDHISHKLLSQFPSLQQKMNEKSKALLNSYVQELNLMIMQDLNVQKSCYLFNDTKAFRLAVDKIYLKLAEVVGQVFDKSVIHLFSSGVAYYDIVCERVVQNISAMMHGRLIERFQNDIADYLIEELSDERLGQLFLEDPKLGTKRLGLNAKRVQLKAILDLLVNI